MLTTNSNCAAEEGELCTCTGTVVYAHRMRFLNFPKSEKKLGKRCASTASNGHRRLIMNPWAPNTATMNCSFKCQTISMTTSREIVTLDVAIRWRVGQV